MLLPNRSLSVSLPTSFLTPFLSWQTFVDNYLTMSVEYIDLDSTLFSFGVVLHIFLLSTPHVSQLLFWVVFFRNIKRLSSFLPLKCQHQHWHWQLCGQILAVDLLGLLSPPCPWLRGQAVRLSVLTLQCNMYVSVLSDANTRWPINQSLHPVKIDQ